MTSIFSAVPLHPCRSRGRGRPLAALAGVGLGALLTTGGARAQVLTAGQTITPTQTITSLSDLGTQLDYREFFATAPNIDPNQSLEVTVRSAVFRGSDGFLSFLYQVTNSTASQPVNALGQIDASIYSSADDTDFTTNVFYYVGDPDGTGPFDNGTVRPFAAERTFDGDTLSFKFAPSPTGFGKVRPGETSASLIVRTNATDYRLGPVATIDGLTANSLGFAPNGFVVVPEPQTAALAAPGVLALCGLAALRRRRGGKREG